MSSRNIVSKGVRYLTDKGYRFAVNRSLFDMYQDMPDDEYLKRLFRYKMGYDLNLDNPQTFNEKLQWLKLYDRRPELTKMVDKYEVKAYVAERIGEQYIIPTLGVWNHFDEIDFDKLSDRFVLKCTHDSGSISICKDKSTWDKHAARIKLEKNLRRNYYYAGREWPYKDVKPQILAEEYLENNCDEGLHDYKTWCFDGKVQYIQYITGRIHNATYEGFYDRQWNLQTFSYHNPLMKKSVLKPDCLTELIVLAEKLTENLPFVRVDFYILPNGQIKFGEITFYPMAGMEHWKPEEMDIKFGKLITLPRKKEITSERG